MAPTISLSPTSNYFSIFREPLAGDIAPPRISGEQVVISSSLLLSLHPILGPYKKDGDKPFSRDRTRVDGFKLKEDILDIMTFFLEGG